MSPAEPFPLQIPGDARRAFCSDDATRRFARVARLERGSHVLVLGCGSDERPVVTLVQDVGCTVVAADSDEAALGALRNKLAPYELGDRVEVQRVDPLALHFPPGAFEAILIPSRVLFPLATALRSLRSLLAVQGRLGLVYPAWVGRKAPQAVLDFWAKRLGEPLLTPRELLQVVESGGYEPESAETLTHAALEALYRDVELRLTGASGPQADALYEEIAQHRQQGGRVVATYAFLIGRRKEPGERPPASHDRG